MKEVCFNGYATWKEKLSHGKVDRDNNVSGRLNIFVVNSFLALIQLPPTLLLIPMSQAIGQTHGKSILSYTTEALTCIFDPEAGSCGTNTDGESAGEGVAGYMVMNVF